MGYEQQHDVTQRALADEIDMRLPISCTTPSVAVRINALRRRHG
jgi:hypothetical protein